MQNLDDLFTSQSAQQEEAPFDKDAWAAKKQAEREGVYAMIDNYVYDMGMDGGVFQAYLDVQARFDLYSVSNAILIAAQCPEATKLADFDSWKASGVYVKRGEDAITILEPGKEFKKDDGSVGVSYNVKKVFDISQTSSSRTSYRSLPPKGGRLAHSVVPPLPAESVDSAGTLNDPQPTPAVARDERLLLKALMNNAPCRFSISNELPEGVNVAYHARDNMIYVRQGLDAPTIFRGLAQELARAHMDKGGIVCESPDFAAYSVSYLLCRRNGVSVEGFSFDRMPECYTLMDAKAVRAEVGVMRDVAGSITTDMNRLFAAQEKAQSVVTRSTSLVSPQAGKLARSAAPPSPTEPASLGFGGDPNRDSGAR